MSINPLQNNTQNEQAHNQVTPRGIHREQLTNIKVPKQTADLIRVYCILNKRKVTEFATEIIEERLAEFRNQMAGEHECWRKD